MTKAATHPAAADDEHVPPADASTRDTSQIVVTDWSRRDAPAAVAGQRERRYQVVVRQSVLNKVHRHGKSVDHTEVCGVLVGNVHHDASGPWLYVEHAIEGNGAAKRAAQVTFTAETWAHIQMVMDRDHPDRRILGWYHTHPGFGIFLSDMDVFIQDNFFGEPWQVALVYDPNANEEGCFLWKHGKPQPDPFLVEPDQPAEHPTTIVRQAREIPHMSTAAAAAAGGAAGGIGTVEASLLADRLDALERRHRLTMTLLAVLALFALAWPLAVVAFLPGVQHKQPPPPPITLPTDDPTSRPVRF